MKQRLLLALLMLFSSVGFMKAQGTAPIKIAVPKEGKVTITLTSSTFEFRSDSYPQLFLGSTAVTPDKSSFKNKTVKWILESKTGAEYQLSTATNSDKWGNLTLSLDGKVTSFVVTGQATNEFQKLITSLSFTNNGVLEQLVLASKNAYKTTGLPKLASLSCAGNKLNYIPSKLGDDGKVKLTTYNVGEQSPSSTRLTTVNVTEPKNGLTLNTSSFDQQTSKIFSETVTGALTISELKDKDGKVVNYAMLESGKYFFKDGDIFMDGEFTAKIAVGSDDKNYPGVVICGVPVKVNAATFILDKANKITIEPKDAGTINVTEPEDSKLSSLTRNTVVKLTPAPNSGYEFDKFEIVAGLEVAGQDGNSYSFKVKGDKAPEIKAIFKAKGATVTYNTPDAAQGTLRVTKAENNELVASGNTVPVGTKLLITAKAKDGYEVGTVTFKKADKTSAINPKEETSTGTEKTWTYEVTIEGLDVQAAAFTALKKELTLTGAVGTITVKDTEGNEYKGGSPSNVYTVPVGKELVVTLKSASSVTDGVINYAIFNSKRYDVVKKQDGSYELKGIVMPNQDSKLVFETSTLQSITVTPAWTSNVKLLYTGTKQEVTFTFDKNVEANSFVVEYKKASDTDAAYTKEAFKEVGKYKVRITRPADDKYKKADVEVSYEIVLANLIVETPTLNVDKDGNISFTNGKAYFMNGDQKVDVAGKFVALASGGTTEITNIKDNDNGKGQLKVTYKVTDASVAANLNKVENFILQYGEELATAKLQAVGGHKGDLTFTMNSVSNNQPMVLPDGSSVAVGTGVKFKITKTAGITEDTKYKVYQANAKGEKLNENSITEYTITKDDKELYFLLEVEDERGKLNLSAAAVSYIKKGFIYGNSWNLTLSADKELYFVDEENNKVSEVDAYKNISITYYKNGVEIAEVIDADDYQVEISRPACAKYTEFKSEKISFTVSPTEIPQATTVKANSATAVGLGQPLSTSKITGVSDIAGEFVWNEDETVILTADGQHKVKFVPESSNYKAKELGVLTVTVSTQPLLTVDCDSEQGRVEIKDAENNYYYDGDLIITDESKPATKAIKAKTLSITAVPADGFVFESFTFIKGGVESTVKTNPCTQSVSDASLDVKANFKEKSAETVYHTISFSSLNVAGVVFNNVSTSNKVKEGDSFNFSMSAHPSDYSRIVVKDNKGKSYSVTSLGACTIDNVQEDLQLTVSLSNPTKYNVTLPAEYKDSEGNLMGTANFSGNTYYGGTITLTAVPKEGYKFVGWLNAGTTSTATTVQVTVTSNMTISARFESDGTIDPNTECIVRTPYDADLTGVSINKQGINVVKIGSDFEFTVSAYKEDLPRVKVTVDGAELKPTTGNKYVISKVKKNTEVKVTLDNPTRIKVVIEKETKNAKGYVMGHVDVDVVDFGTYYPDSTCYYNTKLRLAAYPESGVEFKNWSDVTSNTDLIREITVTDNVTIKPVFEGTPTGIEDIMVASIATGKGCVWVRGIANADLTLVSITGRVQARQRISGDTRIDVPAGIYVVVLESGSDVKRVKVIVK